jgi:hypothetical protein
VTEYDPAEYERTGDAAEPTEIELDPVPAEFPWPPAPGESAITAWGRTWRGAALEPSRFFAALPTHASLGAAVLYYLTIGIPVAGAALFWSMLRDALGMERSARMGALDALGPWAPLIEFLLSPILLLVSLFLAAGVTHLMLKILGAASRDYGTTTRVYAFAYSPQILGVIPWVGTFVGFVWMIVVSIIGLREAHNTSTARAAAAVLVPLAILFMFGVFMALLIAAGGLLELPA